jgi:hypothetical protein
MAQAQTSYLALGPPSFWGGVLASSRTLAIADHACRSPPRT